MDVPGLITVIQTISMSTGQGNEQNIGRLREIEGVDTNYYYLYNPDIKQHKTYSHDRLERIRKVCKTVSHLNYPHTIRSS